MPHKLIDAAGRVHLIRNWREHCWFQYSEYPLSIGNAFCSGTYNVGSVDYMGTYLNVVRSRKMEEASVSSNKHTGSEFWEWNVKENGSCLLDIFFPPDLHLKRLYCVAIRIYCSPWYGVKLNNLSCGIIHWCWNIVCLYLKLRGTLDIMKINCAF